mmetsp:Transcript_8634/g.23435  ORF Transcript_8634/g.23435 Transcript_8634/m.23435 type:complete len:562 (+) Transcript_8634:129-1814(+)|eukprot:CAMPEP_0197482598 /NCGR_PEP_ID=MMETSP1309-20131121/56427_1 /TAXON_ID=464262 /ORGANISM="Genus nov. species nov., Strain RCC998" /LENGTH=561 /DNA_ID=CAMNT_0043025133 /DNA_START=168 /DNA_END=1853 /DNA_ORIENTATION=-
MTTAVPLSSTPLLMKREGPEQREEPEGGTTQEQHHAAKRIKVEKEKSSTSSLTLSNERAAESEKPADDITSHASPSNCVKKERPILPQPEHPEQHKKHVATVSAFAAAKEEEREEVVKQDLNKRAKQTYKTYSPYDMQTAYMIYIESKQLGNTISIRRLAKVSGIPYATLRDHINGRKNKSMGIAKELSLQAELNKSAGGGLKLPLPLVHQQGKSQQQQPRLNINLRGQGLQIPTAATAAATIGMPLQGKVCFPQQQSSSMGTPTAGAGLNLSLLQQRGALNHGVQDMLRFALGDREYVEYNRIMTLQDAKFLEKLQSLGVLKLEGTKQGLDKKQLASMVRASINYFKDFFHTRCSLYSYPTLNPLALKLKAAEHENNSKSFELYLQSMLKSQLALIAEIQNPNSMEWLDGVRFSQIVMKTVAAMYANAKYKDVLPVGQVLEVGKLCLGWVQLEKNLSITMHGLALQSIQQKITTNFAGAGGVEKFLKEYLAVLKDADELRVHQIGQVEKLLVDDRLVLGFRVELLEQYVNALKEKTNPNSMGVLRVCAVQQAALLEQFLE